MILIRVIYSNYTQSLASFQETQATKQKIAPFFNCRESHFHSCKPPSFSLIYVSLFSHQSFGHYLSLHFYFRFCALAIVLVVFWFLVSGFRFGFSLIVVNLVLSTIPVAFSSFKAYLLSLLILHKRYVYFSVNSSALSLPPAFLFSLFIAFPDATLFILMQLEHKVFLFYWVSSHRSLVFVS